MYKFVTIAINLLTATINLDVKCLAFVPLQCCKYLLPWPCLLQVFKLFVVSVATRVDANDAVGGVHDDDDDNNHAGSDDDEDNDDDDVDDGEEYDDDWPWRRRMSYKTSSAIMMVQTKKK